MPASRRKHGNFFVYKFCDTFQQPIYVGQHVTDNTTPITRIRQHIKNNRELWGETKKIFYYKCPTYEYMCNLEGLIIDLANPKYNVEHPPYNSDFAPGNTQWIEFVVDNKQSICKPEIIAKEWFTEFEDFQNDKIDNSFIRRINSKKGRNQVYKEAYSLLKKLLSAKYFGINDVNCNIDLDGNLCFSFFSDEFPYKVNYQDSLNMDGKTWRIFRNKIRKDLEIANKVLDLMNNYYNKEI